MNDKPYFYATSFYNALLIGITKTLIIGNGINRTTKNQFGYN